ncbi:hypothetical protein [Rheinheimera mangrovi]|uniref:hypothetical protein n=1 Tax=Rheinheimera mangrovi TaxID=2498451 RepID=UPI000F8DEE6C|nr:hypothetical protein [Rheinheimera mangrovi]
MKTVKQTSARILIVATLFTSAAALADEAKPTSEVEQPKKEVIVQTKGMSDSFVQELRQQLNHNIKHQVKLALSHSAELIKNSLR